MARQKAAPGKKGSKTKPDRAVAAKTASPADKRAGSTGKTAAKKAQAGSSAPSKKKAAASERSTKKSVTPKPAAKATKPKEATASRTAVQRKPPQKAAKSGPRAAAEAAPKDDSRRGAKPVATKATAAKPASPKTAKPAKPAVKPAPARILGNGQLAGVLQAARSVASKTNKVVEVGKERKSHLTAEELAEFRQILLDKRRELVDDMVNLEDEARRTGSEGGPGSSAMPIHMADLGSDTWEQEFTLNLIEKERTIVREIDEALDRIEKRTYGTCLATGKSISKARLRVKPWAKYCIEYARKRELGLI